MFAEKPAGITQAASFAALTTSKTVILHGEDHDVFGDGAVILKSAPGRWPAAAPRSANRRRGPFKRETSPRASGFRAWLQQLAGMRGCHYLERFAGADAPRAEMILQNPHRQSRILALDDCSFHNQLQRNAAIQHCRPDYRNLQLRAFFHRLVRCEDDFLAAHPRSLAHSDTRHSSVRPVSQFHNDRVLISSSEPVASFHESSE